MAADAQQPASTAPPGLPILPLPPRPPMPADEPRRLARLRELAVLDTPPEALFDSLARAASTVCGTPIALLCLVDAERQWFKAEVGLGGMRQTARELAFCAHTIAGRGTLVVADARVDARFAANPFVTGSPHVRFYAGSPLTLCGGEQVGTLCVLDRQPRTLSAAQLAALEELARAATQALELRARAVDALERQRRQIEGELTGLNGPLPASASVLDLLPVGVSVWDPEFRNLYANATVAHWFRRSHAELLGQPLRSVLGERAWASSRHRFQSVLAGQAQEMRHTLPTSDGLRDHHLRCVPRRDAAGRIDGLVLLADDVTAERSARAAEQALRSSHESLRLLYERTPALLLSLGPDGCLRSVSDQWLARFGHARADVIGRPLLEFIDPTQRRAVAESLLPQLWRQLRTNGLALRLRSASGRGIDVLLSAILQHDAAGEPQRLLVVLDDVTEILARTAELQREQALRGQLQHRTAELQSLLAEREEMIDVLAHEVRQPLNNAQAALQGAGVLLAERGDAESAARLQRAQGVLRQVLDGVDNTLAVVSLVAAGAPAAPTDADFDLAALLALVVGDLAPAERERVRIEALSAVRTATLDSGLMRLALRNLLANALRHSPPDQPVTLRLADIEEPPQIVFEVIDRGSGIDPALLPRLFGRGVRGASAADRARHGLGLFIARRALELQRGTAELVCTGVEGTTMRLTLPQALD